jgi:glycosyltransferase involved in cell wall biosynthesis
MRESTPVSLDGAPAGLQTIAPCDRRAAASVAGLDVLFVLNSLALGGSERKIVRVANQLRQRGLRPGLACLNTPHTLATLVRDDVPMYPLDRRGKFSIAALARLFNIVRQRRPRTLIAVNLYPALYVLAAAALAGRPRPRTIGLLNTSTLGEQAAPWRARLYRRLLPLFDGTVHGCEAQRGLWVVDGSPAWRRSQVIYNGVDLAEYRADAASVPDAQLRAQLGIAPRRFVFGSIGRLAPEKNHAALVTALARLKAANIDAHLVVVGEGALRSPLQELASLLGVRSRLSLPGALTDVRPVLHLLDVFVLPSIAVESFSNAALEAMAMSKAVILSDVGGAAEMVRNGVDGFILSRQELDARLPTLLAALCADPERRARLGAAARARVEAAFSLPVMIERYAALTTAGAGGAQPCAITST